MIAGFAHRSLGLQSGEFVQRRKVGNEILIFCYDSGIQLANGVIVTRENSYASGVGGIFDRVLIELVSKMQEMTMDKTELGCLRAIVLFNPDVKGLQDINRVEQLRERVYATLEEYTRYGRSNYHVPVY